MSKKKTIGLKGALRDVSDEERAALLDGLAYEVGYGKPPLGTRFSSGNQPPGRGRRKGSENMATVLAEELAARVEVTEGGRHKKQSKQRIMLKQAVNRAATGDPKATALVIETLRKVGLLGLPPPETGPLFDERDRQVMERYVEMLSNAASGAGDPGTGDRS